MAIWSAEVKELQSLSGFLSGLLPDLEKELEQLVRTDDENKVLTCSRSCLELIVSDLCNSEFTGPTNTESLEGAIDRLDQQGKVPEDIIVLMRNLYSLSSSDEQAKELDSEQLKPVLRNLTVILKWYLKYKGAPSGVKPKGQEKNVARGKDHSKGNIANTLKRWGVLLAAIVLIAVVAFLEFIVKEEEKPAVTLDKSIAVRPFWNESADKENEFFINGMTEDIRNNLSKIADLRVLSRGSVEKYRDSQYSTIDIARDLHVNYVLEGTAQRIENQVKIHVQLILAERDDPIWDTTFREEIEDVEKVFDIQSQIAQSVANEIKAIITPQEKQLIEQARTSNLTAFDYFLRGRDEHLKYRLDNSNAEALKRAEELYQQALEHDPSYAQAYAGLAMAYWDEHYWDTYFTENFLDSVMILADIALTYDDNLTEAYSLKGDYNREIGNYSQAISEYETAMTINPNYWQAYVGSSILYVQQGDYMRSIETMHKAVQLNLDQELPLLLRNLGLAYMMIGFPEKTEYYNTEALKLDNDSVAFLNMSTNIEIYYFNNFPEALTLARQAYRIDSSDISIIEILADVLILNGQYQPALEYYDIILEKLDNVSSSLYNKMLRIAFCYWKTGQTEEADHYFELQKQYCEEAIALNREYARSGSAYYDLAAITAFKGNRDKAIEYLLEYYVMPHSENAIMLWFIKNDPFFDNLRDDSEFQDIVLETEAKYLAEYDRVRKWLKDNDLL